MTQEQAISILKSGETVFLTGEPGAGKTHIVNAYVGYLRAHNIEPAITASTGIAATHIHGMTIHSWSGIGIKRSLSSNDLEKIAHNKYINTRLRKAKVLIIDEISMLSASTFEMVDAVCRKVRNNPMSFGGLQVVLVGDFFQLPPISRADEESAQFAFDSSAWAELDPTICYITEQHRQDDPDFLSVLSGLRAGEQSDEHRAQLEKRIGRHESVSRALPRLFSHNVDVDVINQRELIKLTGDEREFLMESSGSEKFIETLKRGCLSPQRLVLKIGASVMCTKNNSEDGYINGTLGVVKGFSKDMGRPIIKTHDGQEIVVTKMEWTIEDEGIVRARISQVPLRLAWAMTIHKSQGMSMDAAVIDLSGAFEFGQGYVALSRVKRLSGLYLLGINERALQVHPDVLSRDEDFKKRSIIASTTLNTVSTDEKAQREKDFIITCGGTIDASKPAEKKNIRLKGETSEWMAEKRKTSQNAYMPWSAEDEASLVLHYNKNTDIKALMEIFKRQRGGIISRLKKLGLIDENEFIQS